MKRKRIIFSIAALIALNIAHGQNSDTGNLKTIDLSTFKKVETPAEFPGGPKGWRKYLEQNLEYPKKAYKKKIQGAVRVQFIVKPDGTVSEVQALNDPGGGLAEEAVRIIESGPKWKPATQNGKKVIYRHIQSITFKLG